MEFDKNVSSYLENIKLADQSVLKELKKKLDELGLTDALKKLDNLDNDNSNFINIDSDSDVLAADIDVELPEDEMEEQYEPLMDESKSRFTVFPIEYHDIWDMYKKQLESFWKAEEIDFSKDYDDYMTLSNDEQHFIKMILAFFAASDGIVNFNIRERFSKDVKIIEAQIVYDFQTMMENIHGETYSLMLDNIIKDSEERAQLFDAIHTIPSIKMMADWAFKWIESSKSFAHRVIAFAVVEGVFFSGAFAAIFWFKLYNNKGKNIMPGLTMSNEFISRDEASHTNFACLLYSHVTNKLSSKEVYGIIDEAVKIAQHFMTEALPVRLIGMNSEMMANYIEYIGDRLSMELGYGKQYNKKNPFQFMETIGLFGKASFFETRNSGYSSSKTTNNKKSNSLIISDDF